MKQPYARKSHHHSVFIGSLNEFVIPDASSGLDNVFYTSTGSLVKIVTEREKRVG